MGRSSSRVIEGGSTTRVIPRAPRLTLAMGPGPAVREDKHFRLEEGWGEREREGEWRWLKRVHRTAFPPMERLAVWAVRAIERMRETQIE